MTCSRQTNSHSVGFVTSNSRTAYILPLSVTPVTVYAVPLPILRIISFFFKSEMFIIIGANAAHNAPEKAAATEPKEQQPIFPAAFSGRCSCASLAFQPFDGQIQVLCRCSFLFFHHHIYVVKLLSSFIPLCSLPDFLQWDRCHGSFLHDSLADGVIPYVFC